MVLYWFFLSLKARAFVFFHAANPAIELGGLFGESKWAILKQIPPKWIPRTFLVLPGTPMEEVRTHMEGLGIDFPVIVKPDVGERGFLVEKVHSDEALQQYLGAAPVSLLIQEYVSHPTEVSILYHRLPGDTHGKITSLTLKEFLTVKGDGTSTLETLIKSFPRALLQWPTLRDVYRDSLGAVLPEGEEKILVPIGNHSRGTMFLDGKAHIDERLTEVFDHISQQIPGIYYGRFDIRCKSLESLKAGQDFSILEINGVKSEPTHIYQPGFSLWKAFGTLFHHWDIIYQISIANHRRGVAFPSFWPTLRALRAFFKRKKEIRARMRSSQPQASL